MTNPPIKPTKNEDPTTPSPSPRLNLDLEHSESSEDLDDYVNSDDSEPRAARAAREAERSREAQRSGERNERRGERTNPTGHRKETKDFWHEECHKKARKILKFENSLEKKKIERWFQDEMST